MTTSNTFVGVPPTCDKRKGDVHLYQVLFASMCSMRYHYTGSIIRYSLQYSFSNIGVNYKSLLILYTVLLRKNEPLQCCSPPAWCVFASSLATPWLYTTTPSASILTFPSQYPSTFAFAHSFSRTSSLFADLGMNLILYGFGRVFTPGS